ncbi:hypothetical protein GCM10010341_53630 [Streptomyces noursei]|nr:hypothetical protein GCM10010341_53630 [Streptomyces noursei]
MKDAFPLIHLRSQLQRPRLILRTPHDIGRRSHTEAGEVIRRNAHAPAAFRRDVTEAAVNPMPMARHGPNSTAPPAERPSVDSRRQSLDFPGIHRPPHRRRRCPKGPAGPPESRPPSGSKATPISGHYQSMVAPLPILFLTFWHGGRKAAHRTGQFRHNKTGGTPDRRAPGWFGP